MNSFASATKEAGVVIKIQRNTKKVKSIESELPPINWTPKY